MYHMSMFTPSRVLCRRLSRSLVAALLLVACVLALPHPAAAASDHTRIPQDHYPSLYVHYATAANTYASWTDLDNPITNNNPSAIVYVTPVWNPGGVYASAFDYANVGVWYNIATNKWSIFNEDNSPMPIGAAFNVLGLAQDYAPGYAYTVTAAALSANGSSADLPIAIFPEQVLFAIPTWNGVYDTHPLGVFYHYETGHWALFHEDGAPLVPGAAYNVRIDSPNAIYYAHTATSANSQYGYTSLDNGDITDGDPNGIVFVMQHWTEKHCFQTTYGLICNWPLAWSNSAVSVFYQPVLQRWCIYNDTGAAMPVGAQFNIFDGPML